MGILRDFIIKYRQLLDRNHAKAVKRRQFNMTINAELVRSVKLLAATLKVPCYVITEHMLQVGCYYILHALKDTGKRQELKEHLGDVHRLGSELHDGQS